jgi:hypothetical protein
LRLFRRMRGAIERAAGLPLGVPAARRSADAVLHGLGKPRCGRRSR